MAGGVVTNITTSGTGAGTHLLSSTFYGTCATGASTAAKIVKLADTNVNSATIKKGMLLTVKFTNSNTALSPTLTIQTSGGTQLIAAKNIMQYGVVASGNSEGLSWRAGAIVGFVYDGTNWIEVSSNDGVLGVTAGTGLNTTSNDTGTDGGNITSTGTLYLTKSGVTAGTYQGIQVDKYGRVISASNQGYTTNTGTVTSVSTGAGLTGSVTTTGTIKANLNSETSIGTIGTTDNLYAVGVDSNNKLAVLVSSSGGTSAIIRRWTTA